MIDPLAQSYDETPYPSHAFKESHPGRLAAIARLFGVPAADVTHARVLELGCARGGNLLPMAEGLPHATFLGIDLSSVQIADATARAQSLGLANVRFEALDLRAFPADAGLFDYVICHGVLSWIPEDARRAVFALLDRHLAPNGVAFVSYNVNPGFRLRAVTRDILRFYAETATGSPLERVAIARRALGQIAAADVEDVFHDVVREEVQNLDRCDAVYVLHEHLEAENTALGFDELEAYARAAGLAWLAESPLHRTWPVGPNVSVAYDASRNEAAVLRAQREIDLQLGRPFRRSLLVRRETCAPSGHVLRPAHALDLFVRSAASPERPTDPFAGASYLDEVWPRGITVRELAARSFAREAKEGSLDEHAASLAETMVALASTTRAVELLAWEPPLALDDDRRPFVAAVARERLGTVGQAENLFHEEVRATDTFARALVLLCDGTRTIDELVEAAMNLPLPEAASAPRPAVAEVADVAAKVADVLAYLRRASLLRRPISALPSFLPAPTDFLEWSRRVPGSGPRGAIGARPSAPISPKRLRITRLGRPPVG